jgi:glycogen debranching enzyme
MSSSWVCGRGCWQKLLECTLSELVTTQKYYISTAEVPVDDRPQVLKYGDLFAVFNRYGDIEPSGLGEEGLFYEGTRFLSKFALRLGSTQPLLLSSTITRDNFLFCSDLTNVDLITDAGARAQRGTIHLHRSKFLWEGACYEKFRVTNYGLSPLVIWLRLALEADFADIFEVRGTTRRERGKRLPASVTHDELTLAYEGLDGRVRKSRICCTPSPTQIDEEEIVFKVELGVKEEHTFFVEVSCVDKNRSADWGTTFLMGKSVSREYNAQHCEIHSSNDQFNQWMSRSAADVQTMIRGNPEKNYPYAGIPWFSTVFGRDGIITAMECLWLSPSIARGVLAYLAETQAVSEDPASDAEPGKIVHEIRKGEMAVLKEVPFGLYYGSVDATPLFVMLAVDYYRRTADLEFIRSIWSHIEAALDWIDRYGDRDGDGFVEYNRRSVNGLVQQGWKDSHDSIFHQDGKLAEPPIALCEVQGYVYAAKRGAGDLARLLGQESRADALSAQAKTLRARFDESFWCPEIDSYALALDGHKRQCRVRASNAGHCLFTEIAEPHRAPRVSAQLLGPELFSGWGVRTIGSSEARYNPISYHNGSVWPHDNALIAGGLSTYGNKELAGRILSSLFDVSAYVDLHRLPELFCGLHRRDGEGPTLYPVACSPQAWSAAAIFLLLQACLGLTVDGVERCVRFSDPYLPEDISHLSIKSLEVGSASVDLLVERRDKSVEVRPLNNSPNIRVICS